MTKFLQYLESSGKFLGKPFSAKYINLYNLVLILWKAPKIEETYQNDKNYHQLFMIFGISRHIWENVLSKAYKSIYHEKDNFIRFSFFFFWWEYFALFHFFVIGLLVTAYMIHRRIFGHFLPPLAQIFD